MWDGQIVTLESLLTKLEETLCESDYKDITFSKVRKRKNEKEERMFVARIGVLMRHLAEFKGDRTMVHVFHLRFIHTTLPIRRSRQSKIIAQVTEYLRIMNKHYQLGDILNNSNNSNNNNNYDSLPMYDSPLTLDSSTPTPTYSTPPMTPLTSIIISQPPSSSSSSSASSSSTSTPVHQAQQQLPPNISFLRNIDRDQSSSNSTNSSSSSSSSSSSKEQQSTLFINLSLSNLSFGKDRESLQTSTSGGVSPHSPSIQASSLNITTQSRDNGTDIKVARELLEYLSTHQVDPDNSLVGCEINSTYVDELFKYRSQTSYSKQSIVKMVKSWGSLKDDHLVKEVRKMSSIFNNLDYKRGELVIVDINNNNRKSTKKLIKEEEKVEEEEIEFDFGDQPNITTTNFTTIQQSNLNLNDPLDESIELNSINNVYIFARVEEQYSRMVRVNTNPSEDSKTLLSLDIAYVYKLSPEIVEQIRNHERVNKLVSDPSVAFSHSLSFKEKAALNKYLESLHIDTQIFERCRNNTVQLEDLPTIRLCLAKCSELNDSLPKTRLYQDVMQMVKQETKPFIEGVRKTCFYIPILNQIETLVKTIESERTGKLRARINQAIISLDSANFKLQVESKEILEGITKNRLSQWWLGLIREHVESFLVKNGYDFNCVPQDYMEKPPTNFQAVKNNLSLLHILMNSLMEQQLQHPNIDILELSSSSTFTNQELLIQKEFNKVVNRLIETIYPIIKEFIFKSKMVVLDCLELFDEPISTLESKGLLELNTLRQLYLKKKDHFDKQKVGHLDRIFKDVDYIIEMKRLENVLNEKRLDIVPISGLAIGRIHRFENEMRTVIEIWKHIDPLNQPTLIQQQKEIKDGSPNISPNSLFNFNNNNNNNNNSTVVTFSSTKNLSGELHYHNPPQKPLPTTPTTNNNNNNYKKISNSNDLFDQSPLLLSPVVSSSPSTVSPNFTSTKKWNEPSKPINRLLNNRKVLVGSGGSVSINNQTGSPSPLKTDQSSFVNEMIPPQHSLED